MENINDIKQLMKDYKITQEEIAEDLGVMQQTVSSWFSRNRIPKNHDRDLKQAIARRVRTMDAVTNEFFSMNKKDESAQSKNENVLSIKLYDMSVSAGVGFDVDSIHEMQFTQLAIDRSIIPSHILSSDLVAMKVDGKSMIPTILPNEIVIYKEDMGRYSGDALYIVNFGGMLMVKRIQFNPENGKFDIIADNKEFKSYCVDIKDDQTTFIIIGKVIATIQQ